MKAARSIPLPISNMEDRLIWHFSKRGGYTVSSGYETALGLKRLGMMAGPSMDYKVWNLATKIKIKFFVWKCINEILPFWENLFQKGSYKGDVVYEL